MGTRPEGLLPMMDEKEVKVSIGLFVLPKNMHYN
jgi:hypothetical protein